MMNANDYLPLGSVVMLKEGRHRVMVVGFCTNDPTVDNKMYDYMGCFFPEGIFTLDKMLAFNHKDIEKIYFEGFSDEEEKNFKNKLEDAKNKLVDENGNMKNFSE